jgi:hypothetical protein
MESKQTEATEYIGIRGGIEIMLKNALDGSVILHHKGLNAVLNGGRNELMTRAFTTISHTSILQPNIIIGSGTTTANASDSGPLAYFTWKTGGIASTAGSGATAPVMLFTGSWESTELNATGFNVIREFCLGFNTISNSSNNSPYLCRYVSSANINATTSNQLLISYSISF